MGCYCPGSNRRFPKAITEVGGQLNRPMPLRFASQCPQQSFLGLFFPGPASLRWGGMGRLPGRRFPSASPFLSARSGHVGWHVCAGSPEGLCWLGDHAAALDRFLSGMLYVPYALARLSSSVVCRLSSLSSVARLLCPYCRQQWGRAGVGHATTPRPCWES